MAALPSHARGSAGAEALTWPVLATIFLIGIGLVSLGDIVSEGEAEVPALEVPPNLQGEPLWLLAPGWEDVLLDLPNRASTRVLAPWAPLPRPEGPVVVARPDGYELPRVPEGVTVGDDLEAGEWVLARLEPLDAAPVAEGLDLTGELRHASVAFVHPDGSETRCDRWRFGRWACGLEEWLWVGPTELPFRNRSRACVWAHPRAGDRLEIRFRDVPLGRRVTGRYGLSDLAVDVEDGAPVSFVVRAGGAEERFVAENRRGFFSYDVDTEPAASGEIVFAVTAERDGRRHFCFSGEVRGVGDPATDEPAQPSGDETGDDGEFDDVEPDDVEPDDGEARELGPPARRFERAERVRRAAPLTHVEAVEIVPGTGEGTGGSAGEGSGTGAASEEGP